MVDRGESGEIDSAADMVECAKSEEIESEPGDAVLLRTGYLNIFDPKKSATYFDGCLGFGLSTIKIFNGNGTVALGADTAYIEVHPSEVKTENVPLHEELLWRRGLYFLELLNLEALAKDRVYEFLLIVNPLNI
jgi:kynurenine formamidase